MEGEKECSPAGSNPIWQKASEHLDLPFILGEGIGSKSKPEELYEDSDKEAGGGIKTNVKYAHKVM